MGQRLVITVRDHAGDKVAALYYHWSAYTTSALEVAKNLDAKVQEILADFPSFPDYTSEELLDAILSAAESMGGGIDGGAVDYTNKEYLYARRLLPNHTFLENPDRNEGLVAFSEKAMEDLGCWAEGNAVLYVEDGELDNVDVYSYYSGLDSINDERKDCDPDAKPIVDNSDPAILVTDADMENCSMSNIGDILDIWRTAEDSGQYIYSTANDAYYRPFY